MKKADKDSLVDEAKMLLPVLTLVRAKLKASREDTKKLEKEEAEIFKRIHKIFEMLREDRVPDLGIRFL